ncbi:MAG: hypothetical protein M3323_07595 [Actinomycetota bacterium]|nr:hypothetical protein [Actinomycetota bacterium]
MATTAHVTADRLAPVKELVARAVSGRGLEQGSEGKAVLRIEREDGVRRTVQVYWTPFEANVPGPCISLHLEVAEPAVHWAEAYLTPDYRNWVFFFGERNDGEIQLLHYADFATPDEAVQAFFDKAAWYTLIPTDKSWEDTTYTVAGDVGWAEAETAVEAGSVGPGVQESLKKSTIVWLRWRDPGTGRDVTMPVWFVYDNKTSKIYVLSGERQQTIPGAERLRECDVIFRWKGKNARIGEVPARVRVIPHGAEWDEIAEKVAEKRLNIPGLPEDTARRWRDECVLLELSLLA